MSSWSKRCGPANALPDCPNEAERRTTTRYCRCGGDLARLKAGTDFSRQGLRKERSSGWCGLFRTFPQPQSKGRERNGATSVWAVRGRFHSQPCRSEWQQWRWRQPPLQLQLLPVWNASLRPGKSGEVTSWEIRKEFFPRAQVWEGFWQTSPAPPPKLFLQSRKPVLKLSLVWKYYGFPNFAKWMWMISAIWIYLRQGDPLTVPSSPSQGGVRVSLEAG